MLVNSHWFALISAHLRPLGPWSQTDMVPPGMYSHSRQQWLGGRKQAPTKPQLRQALLLSFQECSQLFQNILAVHE